MEMREGTASSRAPLGRPAHPLRPDASYTSTGHRAAASAEAKPDRKRFFWAGASIVFVLVLVLVLVRASAHPVRA
ncbi:uncharacterized protein V6R79_003234 [Siganus canaliculatus]